KSPYVEATVHNAGPEPVRIVEVDYPSASFGTESLAAGQDFHYRFKVQGEGDLKVAWIDSAHHPISVKGPTLHEGAEGSLGVVLSGTNAEWNLQVKP
ncbi:MAG: hypothetical protein ABI142_11260, partial [Bryocella sp.]